MRLLHLYAGNLFGGIERMLVTLAGESPRRTGLRQAFGLCFEGRLARELREAGGEVHPLGEVRFSRPWTLWRARRNVRGLLRRERFDAVICHACWPHAAFAAAVRSAGVPLVFWAHDTLTGTTRFDRLAARHPPDLVIANSRFTATTVPSVFGDAPVRVIHGPLALSPRMSEDERTRRRAELGVGVEDRVVAIVARLEPLKGHATLLEAFASVATSPAGSRARLWIVGGAQREHERAYLRSLERLADTLGLAGRVNWFGQRDDARDLVALADVLCQPNSGVETFGLALVEALAAGVPVVTSAMGGPLEIVTPDCGSLVPAGDVREVAAAIADWLPRAGEAGLADRCRRRAVELCDPSARLAELERVLQTLSSGPRGPGAGSR